MGSEIHWVAVLVAAFVGFALGGIWYGPLFGKAWMNARGIAKEDTAGMNMPLIFGTTYVLNVIMAFALDYIYGTHGMKLDLHGHLFIAGLLASGFVVPAMGVNYLFSRMSFKLFLIDGFYWLVNFHLVALVLYFMPSPTFALS